MKFTKMHGIGNDYVYVNCLSEEVACPEETAKFVSDRHFGVGSDGLILIKPSQKADFEMAMYNADGSRGEMCGNGIRCVAKYVYDYGLTDKTRIQVETLAGIKELDLTVENGKVSLVKVNMGSPELSPEMIPVLPESSRPSLEKISEFAGDSAQPSGQLPELPLERKSETEAERQAPPSAAGKTKETAVNVPLEVDGKTYQMTCVSMGNPHCVIFLEEDVRDLDLEKIGPSFENHPRFPKRINTEFVNIIDRHTLRMRVWERGSGETLACGTGACATAVAAILNEKTEHDVTVQLLGGDLHISWEGGGKPVYMTGPATTVFDGEVILPAGSSDVIV